MKDLKLKHRPILVLDIECDSLDTNKAKLKWFGAYSYTDDKYHLIMVKDKKDMNDVRALIKRHKVIVGFNQKEFDNEIIKNNFNDDDMFNYKNQVDLLEISAAKGNKEYGQNRKNRLAQMGFKLKSFTLKNIIEKLKLDEDGTKGDIDYKIFQKDDWTDEEIKEIRKYLKQDIVLTKKLFEWYEEAFAPLKQFLQVKDRENFLYLRCSLAVLAYNIICYKTGMKVEFGEKTPGRKSYSGGHHLLPRWDLVKGNIIEVDFASAYPHAIMMGNLHSNVNKEDEGWDGDGYYIVDGKYNNKTQGKIELALKDIFLERIKAKKATKEARKIGDKIKEISEDAKNKSYKIVINSHYGTSGNPVFKNIYNRNTASDCTSIVRTWMKKLAKILEINGFENLYGFTDSVYVLIPPELNKEHLMNCVEEFLKEAMSHVPFPTPDTFKMDIEEEIKMIWFVAKNCYLFVTQDDEVKYKSTLLNTNTPKAVMKLFKEYMEPIILEQLEIPFTRQELETEIKKILEKEPELAAQEYKVTKKNEYKVQTSIQYQISDKYGSGRHFLIPNKKSIGIGKQKNTKKKVGIRHCSFEEFRKEKLTIDDVDLKHLLTHLRPFYKRNDVVVGGDKSKQETLNL